MHPTSSNNYPDNLKQSIILNFTHAYINQVNGDIFKAIDYYGNNNMQFELKELQAILARVLSNISHYLDKIICNNNATNITKLGDMHGYSRCTVLVESGKRKLIYKPITSHFLNLINEILDLFNNSGKFDFYILKILYQNKKYSKIEFIKNENIFDLNKFSYHYGAIIFILTLLRGTDFHAENIFTVSSTPVIIDYEALFYPIISEFKYYDVTATSLIKTKNNSNTLMNHYRFNKEKILQGIHSSCDIISKNHAKITKLINYYGLKSTRVIFKPTSYYLNLLKNSTHPSLLTDPEKIKKYLMESLYGTKSISSKIMKFELDDLLNFNVPSFYFENENLLSSKKILIKQEILTSPLNQIHSEMNDLKWLKRIIIKALQTI